jgi:hypothetical protein
VITSHGSSNSSGSEESTKKERVFKKKKEAKMTDYGSTRSSANKDSTKNTENVNDYGSTHSRVESKKKIQKDKKKSVSETATLEDGVAPPGSGPPGKCIECKNLQMWSKRSAMFIQRCKLCTLKKRESNRDSYHSRHKVNHQKEAMEEQLASRGEKLYSTRRDCASLRERLAVCQKRYDSVQEAYEGSQKMLAVAIDKANGGDGGGVELPSAVSVRNESIVVQRLQELTETMTERRCDYIGELAVTRKAMEDERVRYAEIMQHSLADLERSMEKLMRKT